MATRDRPPQRSGNTVPGEFDDPSIPVLTERLTLPPLEIDFTLPPALSQPPTPAPAARPDTRVHGLLPELPPELPAEPVAAAPAPEPETVAAPAPPEPAWEQIELELRESVLRELSMRLPQNVEQIVREKMQPGIEAALQRLASETRMAIAASLRDIVDRAVRVEVERLKAQRASREP